MSYPGASQALARRVYSSLIGVIAVVSALGVVNTSSAADALETGRRFLAENATKPGVVTLPSGLQYQVLSAGAGPTPGKTDVVTTHYHGTLVNGTVFDSSVDRGEPVSFPVQGVIPGWVEALQLMPVGAKWRLFVPSELAYGKRGAGDAIGPDEVLIFDVELLSIAPP